ncbi:MAG: hypothetical protein J6V72_14955 [Kiritimatiellae bacterium]|nr:hypothetical protein [Kiritimatiellia bacterium]
MSKAEPSDGNASQVQMVPAENQIVVYQPNETVRLDVLLENETVWLNRHQMAQLFGRDIKTIGKHNANALSEELACNSVVSDFATTQKLIVIDDCPGVATLDMPAKRGRDVKIERADLRSQNITSKADVKEAA